MNNISDQAFASLYEELEEAFDCAKFIGDYRKAMEIALMMRSLEQSGLVPHIAEDDEEGETVH